MDDNLIEQYMKEISRYDLITPKEEVELAACIHAMQALEKQEAKEHRRDESEEAERIRRKGEEARTKLINCNLRLVVKISYDFKGRELPLLDLINEGNIGLIRAVENFDPSKGCKLSSYASWRIKQGMRKALSQQGKTIRIPVGNANRIRMIKEAKLKLKEKLGRKPTNAEIADSINLNERTVKRLKNADRTTISIHSHIQKGKNGTFEDLISNRDIFDRKRSEIEKIEEMEEVERMLKHLNKLTKREIKIITDRFGLNGKRPKTLEEISRVIGVTRERVRQIQNRVLNKIHNWMDEENKRLIENQPKIKVGKVYLYSSRPTKLYRPTSEVTLSYRPLPEYRFLKGLRYKIVKELNQRKGRVKDSELATILLGDESKEDFIKNERERALEEITNYEMFKQNGKKDSNDSKSLFYKILNTIGDEELISRINRIDEKKGMVLRSLYIERNGYKKTAIELGLSEEEIKQVEFITIYSIAESLGLNNK